MLEGSAPRTMTIVAGSQLARLTVNTTDDEKDEPASTVTARVISGTGYALGAVASATITVIDDDEPSPTVRPPTATSPLITVTANSEVVTEGALVMFTVHSEPAPAADMMVDLWVSETGAMLFGGSSRTATISAGTGTGTLTVRTVGDEVDEPDSTVTAAVVAGAGYAVGPGSSASVTVEDDDEPLPLPVVTIAAATHTVTEGISVEFTVRANPSPAADLPVSVTLTVTGDPSSTTRQHTVQYLAGDPVAVQKVTIPPAGAATMVTVTILGGAGQARLTVATPADEEAGYDRTLTATVIAANGYTLGSDTAASVTVQDDGTPGEPRPPGAILLGFAYVAYDLTGLRGTEVATAAAPELIPPGTLPIPFADPVVLGAKAANGNHPAIPGAVTQGQCVAVESATYPARYAALGGSGITYGIGLQGEHATEGHLFTVYFSNEMAFTGMANVVAGHYSYVLEATHGMQRQSRAWKLAVTARELPVDSADDDREDDLHGDTVVDDEHEESVDGIAGDWADSVPEDFATTDDTTATVMNIPRLALPGASAAPAGLSLDATIDGANDVDVFWLGSLAPNWKLELKVVGDSKKLELYAMGKSDPVLSTAETHTHQLGGLQGGLSCANHYLRVSGKPGQYRLGWRLTKP